MKTKRILAIILVFTMLVSMVACSKGEKQPEGSGGNAAPTKAAANNDNSQFDFTKSLSNPNASDKANAIYNWLISIRGKNIISGHQEKCGDTENAEFKWIKEQTGHLPALRGLDFINGDYAGVVRRSKTWAKQNSLISICWHMGVPGSVDKGYDSSKGSFLELSKALDDPNSDGYKQIIADMDKGAEALKELQDAGVVVLWRPFHEFDGKWFWWGKAGGETFVKLWQLMYDRYTNYHKLNNLIWVLGYAGNSSAGSLKWYPGDEYVDIVGADSYTNKLADEGYVNMYNKMYEALGKKDKPAALHECGRIPDIKSLEEGNIDWLWFLTWHSGYVDNENTNSLIKLIAAYESEYVLTLDEMPDFNSIK